MIWLWYLISNTIASPQTYYFPRHSLSLLLCINTVTTLNYHPHLLSLSLYPLTLIPCLSGHSDNLSLLLCLCLCLQPIVLSSTISISVHLVIDLSLSLPPSLYISPPCFPLVLLSSTLSISLHVVFSLSFSPPTSLSLFFLTLSPFPSFSTCLSVSLSLSLCPSPFHFPSPSLTLSLTFPPPSHRAVTLSLNVVWRDPHTGRGW